MTASHPTAGLARGLPDGTCLGQQEPANLPTAPGLDTLRIRAVAALCEGLGYEDACVPREIYFAVTADIREAGALAAVLDLPSGRAPA